MMSEMDLKEKEAALCPICWKKMIISLRWTKEENKSAVKGWPPSYKNEQTKAQRTWYSLSAAHLD